MDLFNKKLIAQLREELEQKDHQIKALSANAGYIQRLKDTIKQQEATINNNSRLVNIFKEELYDFYSTLSHDDHSRLIQINTDIALLLLEQDTSTTRSGIQTLEEGLSRLIAEKKAIIKNL